MGIPVHSAEELGLAIRERRRALGLDQRSLAERVGVSRQWVVAVERGKARAEVGLVLRTLRALGLTVELSVEGALPAPPGAVPPQALVDIDAVVERARGPRR